MTPRRTSRGRVAATLGAVSAVALLGVLIVSRDRDRASALPVYVPAPTAWTVDPADFLAAEACEGCHVEQYARWAGSTHGRAGGDPGPELILAAFDGTPIRFADATAIPTILDGDEYAFIVEWSEGLDTLRIDGVVGGGHMEVGGTQGFFTLWVDGTQRFVPFDWSRHEQAWFCNTRHPNRGEWRRITPAMRLAECADWPPRRMLGQISGVTNCDTCHGSQIRVSFEPSTGRISTRYTGLEINCESCHGPGRRHVELIASGAVLTSSDLGFVPQGTLDEDGSLETCFRCHATRLVLHDGDLPGEPLLANASLHLPMLTDRPFLPDNRVASFAYQLNHRGSGCYLDGAMTCVSCHEPHAQSYQDEYGRTLSGRFDDGQCLGCHVSKAADVTAHTFHPAGSEGSLCVSCHMPYLQQPSLGDDVQYGRSDHTIPIPRPGLDEQFGVTSACAGCHIDEDVRSLARQVGEWYGSVKPWRPLVQGIARAPSVSDPAEAADLLLRPQDGFAMAQVSALSQYLIRFLGPDMPTLDRTVRARLEALAADDDIDVRALALASLHLAAGRDPDVQALLRARVEEMGEEQALLRDRWSAALTYVGDVYRAGQTPDAAAIAYRRALEARPGEPQAQEGLGLALLASGDLAGAEVAFRSAFAFDSTRAAPLANLAETQARLGRPEEEMATLAAAVQRFPFEPLTHFRLGNARLRRRDFLRAKEAFERAIELDVALASPRLGLAQVLAAEGRMDEARHQVDLALTFEPGNPQARQLAGQFDR